MGYLTGCGLRMIERLYVQNFRCLESVTLDFAGSPSAVIIGKNGRREIDGEACALRLSKYLSRIESRWYAYHAE